MPEMLDSSVWGIQRQGEASLNTNSWWLSYDLDIPISTTYHWQFIVPKDDYIWNIVSYTCAPHAPVYIGTRISINGTYVLNWFGYQWPGWFPSWENPIGLWGGDVVDIYVDNYYAFLIWFTWILAFYRRPIRKIV
jgi:hypothetical protein